MAQLRSIERNEHQQLISQTEINSVNQNGKPTSNPNNHTLIL